MDSAKKVGGGAKMAHTVKRPCREKKDDKTDPKTERESPDVNKVSFVRHPSATVSTSTKKKPVIVSAFHEADSFLPAANTKGFAPLPSRTSSDDRASRLAAPPAVSGPASELDLHSVHRVGADILDARAAISRSQAAAADPGERERYARRRLEEAEPEERAAVEREAARGVDFDPEEVLFKDLQALDVSESEFREGGGSSGAREGIRRRPPIPMPRMEDFHTPYAGEDRPVEDGEQDMEEILKMLDKTRKERRMRKKKEGDGKSAEDSRKYVKKLDEWGLR